MNTNCWLSIRYKLLKNLIKPVKNWGTLVYEDDFKSSKIDYTIIEDYMYNGNSYMSKDCVVRQNDGLHLKTIKLDPPEHRKHWSGEFDCYWKCGWVEYHNEFTGVYGTWEFKVELPNVGSFPAIWFLREPYCPKELRYKCNVSRVNGDIIYIKSPSQIPMINWYVFDKNSVFLGKIDDYNEDDGYILLDRKITSKINEIIIGIESIKPEVDLMEIIPNGLIKQSIHYGYDYNEYHKYSESTTLDKVAPKKEYTFAVRMLPNKYEFYIDGIKTGEFNVGLSIYKPYLILNSGATNGITNGNINDFIIKSIKYYK